MRLGSRQLSTRLEAFWSIQLFVALLISRARLTSILTDFQVDLGLINVLYLYLLFLLFLLLLNQVYGLIQLSVTIKSTFINLIVNLTLANAADLCLFARLLSCTQLDPTISDWKVDLIQFSSTFPSQLDVFKEPDLGLLTWCHVRDLNRLDCLEEEKKEKKKKNNNNMGEGREEKKEKGKKKKTRPLIALLLSRLWLNSTLGNYEDSPTCSATYRWTY